MKALEYNKDSALEAANIRPAPKAFEREGTYLHELVWKDGPWAIYRYRFIKSEKPEPHWKYEAVILRIGNPHPRSEDRRLREALPSNSDWGSWGWSLIDYDSLIAYTNSFDVHGEKISREGKS